MDCQDIHSRTESPELHFKTRAQIPGICSPQSGALGIQNQKRGRLQFFVVYDAESSSGYIGSPSHVERHLTRSNPMRRSETRALRRGPQTQYVGAGGRFAMNIDEVFRLFRALG